MNRWKTFWVKEKMVISSMLFPEGFCLRVCSHLRFFDRHLFDFTVPQRPTCQDVDVLFFPMGQEWPRPCIL